MSTIIKTEIEIAGILALEILLTCSYSCNSEYADSA